MATIHRISEEFFVDSFELIALHSNLEPYAMAYYLNQFAGLKLKRAEDDLEIGNIFFPLYEWKDTLKDQEWFLMGNKVMLEEEGDNSGLFESGSIVRSHYLIAEKKKINYILKLNWADDHEISRALEVIRNVPKVSMAYSLDIDDLKSKRNLIF